MATPTVFLDRDGTLSEEVGYLDRLARFRLFPWSVDAVRLLNRSGFAVVVVTNQAGVARGFLDEAFIAETHAHLGRLMTEGAARIDGFYYCPHHPDVGHGEYRTACDCRKPAPGMLYRAARELDLDLARSFVVGDRWLDVELAQNAGAMGVLVRTGYGRSEESRPPEGTRAAFVADNLMAAVSWILRTSC